MKRTIFASAMTISMLAIAASAFAGQHGGSGKPVVTKPSAPKSAAPRPAATSKPTPPKSSGSHAATQPRTGGKSSTVSHGKSGSTKTTTSASTKSAGSSKTSKTTKTSSTSVAPSTSTTLTPVQQKLQRNTNLAGKLQSRLPAGTDLQAAAAGFRNLGQFVAAVNVSNNLGIPFSALKTRMVDQGMSLGQAIQDARPQTTNTTVVARRAESEADDLIRTTDPTTVKKTKTSPRGAKK
jgi:hypothetical protein